MKIVVDTNVLAYLLLKTQPFFDEADGFWRTVYEPIAPASWEAEFANVVWVAVQARVLRPEEGLQRLDAASRLGINSVPSSILWLGALDRSIVSGVAVYDTLFVELAARERVGLATFDRKVLAAFPDVAKRPRDLAVAEL
jgi:predicted nucleic acid-binding protein